MKQHRSVTLLSLIGMAWLLFAGAHPPLADPEQPTCYLRQATWHETLRVSREALLKQEKATGQGLPLPEFGASDYTFMAWIRTTAATGALFSKSSPDGPWACNGKVFFVSNGRLCYDVGCISVVGADTPVNDGRWHHVALTYSDSERVVEFFVDGKVDGHVSQKGNPDLPTDILRLGSIASNFHAQPSGFNGDMDEAQIFCRRLSADEIAGHYRLPQAPLGPSCVGFWSFEKEAVDVSGNNNHGRLEGTVTVEGRFGDCLRFDGKSSVLVPNAKADARVARERLWDLLERDFPDTTSRRQRLYERQDHLWDADWEVGNFQSLARRYAAASNRVPFLRQQAETLAAGVKQTEDLQTVRQLYHRSRKIDEAVSAIRSLN
ncbi:MAG: LamG domain-containing protein, partial [Armatimonadetes bacterium]|nr:LamG domain-containing protein [Armatimonadota bacterium]